MKKIYPVLIVLILFSCTELVISIEEPIKRIPERPESSAPVPSGSYQDRCRNCNANDGILTCECRDNDGEWNVTRLSYQDCRGDIWNDDGLLRCEKNKVIDNTPPGSYRDQCRNCSTEDGILECECRDNYGEWNLTGLTYQDCKGDIWTTNGELGCEKGDIIDNTPLGSYRERCRECRVYDGILECECRDNYGDWETTRLAYEDCQGDIWSKDGLLGCEKREKITKKPPGSYQQTCKDCSTYDGQLECECREKEGGWRKTRLKYWKCDGDIWNHDGALGCDQYSKKDKKPRGSYEKTCRECTYLYGVLECECRKKNGVWQRTQINQYKCNGPIMNDDGVLRCN